MTDYQTLIKHLNRLTDDLLKKVSDKSQNKMDKCTRETEIVEAANNGIDEISEAANNGVDEISEAANNGIEKYTQETKIVEINDVPNEAVNNGVEKYTRETGTIYKIINEPIVICSISAKNPLPIQDNQVPVIIDSVSNDKPADDRELIEATVPVVIDSISNNKPADDRELIEATVPVIIDSIPNDKPADDRELIEATVPVVIDSIANDKPANNSVLIEATVPDVIDSISDNKPANTALPITHEDLVLMTKELKKVYLQDIYSQYATYLKNTISAIKNNSEKPDDLTMTLQLRNLENTFKKLDSKLAVVKSLESTI
jgi:hypothetical protein